MSEQTPPPAGDEPASGRPAPEWSWAQPAQDQSSREGVGGLGTVGAGWAPPPPPAGYAPPDPATMTGPPWPVLVAVGPYTPPRLIRWPIVVGLAVFAAFIIGSVSISINSTSISHASWLADHEGTINTLNRDQQNLSADNPAQGGDATQWLVDWRTFHQDVGRAASLPNPGGSATAPWREMINDFYNGSGEIIQALVNRDQGLAQQGQRDLSAGAQAAGQFNRAMGISTP